MKILVIGESAKDVFIYSKVERLDPSVAIPVIVPVNIEENPGLARKCIS